MHLDAIAPRANLAVAMLKKKNVTSLKAASILLISEKKEKAKKK